MIIIVIKSFLFFIKVVGILLFIKIVFLVLFGRKDILYGVVSKKVVSEIVFVDKVFILYFLVN